MKNTCLKSPVVVLQVIKYSPWEIEKLYSKTFVRNSFLREIYTAITRFTQALYDKFYPCVDEKNYLIHDFTQRDYTPGKINHLNYTWGEKNGDVDCHLPRNFDDG